MSRIYRNNRPVLDLHLLTDDELEAAQKAVKIECERRQNLTPPFTSMLDLPSFVHLNLEQAEELQEYVNRSVK